jgi:hypothetical protein
MVTTGRVIDVREASLKTAQVEIKSLTVSGKQVTLAVFRQLVEEPFMEPGELEVAGTAWGFVSYHPDKCSEGARHTHVVWQKGDELRRASVRPNQIHGWAATERDELLNLVRLGVVRGLEEGAALEMSEAQGRWQITSVPGGRFYGTADEKADYSRYAQALKGDFIPRLKWTYTEQSDSNPMGLVIRDGDYEWYPTQEAAVRDTRERVMKRIWVPQDLAGAPSGVVWDRWERDTAILARAQEAWEREMAAIRALDQLFIAV